MSKPPPLPDTAAKNNLLSAKNVALTFILTVLLAFGSYGVFIQGPQWDEETRLFQQLKSADVTRIELGRTSYGELVKSTLTLQDPVQIRALCHAIRNAKEKTPSHPIAQWTCKMRWVTAGRTWTADIHSTSNNGVLIYLDDGNPLRNDSLGPMLEKIVKGHEQAHPSHPSP